METYKDLLSKWINDVDSGSFSQEELRIRYKQIQEVGDAEFSAMSDVERITGAIKNIDKLISKGLNLDEARSALNNALDRIKGMQ